MLRVAVETFKHNGAEAGHAKYTARETTRKQPLMCLKQVTLQRALTLSKTEPRMQDTNENNYDHGSVLIFYEGL